RIEIRTNRLVNESLAGEYHSVFKGRGMEFSEVREYQFGDDIRSIDWNVTARVGHPYVKKHVEERELTVILLVDFSGSGQFGRRTSPRSVSWSSRTPRPAIGSWWTPPTSAPARRSIFGAWSVVCSGRRSSDRLVSTRSSCGPIARTTCRWSASSTSGPGGWRD